MSDARTTVAELASVGLPAIPAALTIPAGFTVWANERREQTWVYLRGPEGAVQFAAMRVPGGLLSSDLYRTAPDGGAWLPTDLGYHSPTPRYGDEKPLDDSCDVIGSVPCFCDGSGLAACRVWDAWAATGFAASGLVDELFAYYRSTFGDRP